MQTQQSNYRYRDSGMKLLTSLSCLHSYTVASLAFSHDVLKEHDESVPRVRFQIRHVEVCGAVADRQRMIYSNLTQVGELDSVAQCNSVEVNTMWLLETRQRCIQPTAHC